MNVQKIAEKAMVTLVRLCPEIREASSDTLDRVCAAMRSAAPSAIDKMMADIRDVPWMAEVAAQVAVLEIAHAGIKALKG